MKKAALHVHAGSTAVGLLARSTVEPDTILFSYRPGTEAAGAVSLTMPVRELSTPENDPTAHKVI
jgi:hypothetical protein